MKIKIYVLQVLICSFLNANVISSGVWQITYNIGTASAVNLKNNTKIIIYKDKNTKTDAAKNNGYWMEEKFQLLSVVSKYVSFQRTFYSEGGAHPSYGKEFRTVDLDKNGTTVSLKNIFTDKDLFEALMKDKIISTHLSNSPSSLDGLFNVINGGCEMDLSETMLNSFGFHHVNSDSIAIRIGIGSGCETDRGKFIQIGIYLPIPPQLKDAFVKAEAVGSLMDKLIQQGKK